MSTYYVRLSLSVLSNHNNLLQLVRQPCTDLSVNVKSIISHTYGETDGTCAITSKYDAVMKKLAIGAELNETPDAVWNVGGTTRTTETEIVHEFDRVVKAYLNIAQSAREFKKEQTKSSGKDEEAEIESWHEKDIHLSSMFTGFSNLLKLSSSNLFSLRASPHATSFDDSAGNTTKATDCYPQSVPWGQATYLKDVFYRYGSKKSHIPGANAANDESVVKGTVRNFVAKNEVRAEIV